jgi:hypothetical protein
LARHSCTMPMTAFATTMTPNRPFCHRPVRATRTNSDAHRPLKNVNMLACTIWARVRLVRTVVAFVLPAAVRAATSASLSPSGGVTGASGTGGADGTTSGVLTCSASLRRHGGTEDRALPRRPPCAAGGPGSQGPRSGGRRALGRNLGRTPSRGNARRAARPTRNGSCFRDRSAVRGSRATIHLVVGVPACWAARRTVGPPARMSMVPTVQAMSRCHAPAVGR